MNNIRTVIFDFDGTLADTQHLIKKTFLKTVKDIRAPIPIDSYFNKITSFTLEEMFREVGVVKKEMLQKAISLYCNIYNKIAPKNVKLFSGAEQTLNILKEHDFILAIATNERKANFESLFLSLNLHSYFSVTVCEDEVHLPKPYPDMVYKILNETGSSPSNTLIVGDSTLDISIGKTTGCHTCAVTYGAHPEKKLRQYSPDWLIDYPLNLLSILNIPSLPSILHNNEKNIEGYQA